MSWEKVKLGDIATYIQPGPFGSQLHNSDYSESGTPIIMPKDMIDGKISHSNLIFVGEEHTKRLCRHQVHTGNLMVARKGDVRKCVFITENEDGWMTGSDCLKVALKENVCYPRFIYYQLRSPFIGRWLEKISIGATMPSINTGLLSSIELVLPPIKDQKRIADILSAYDDLIENNQKQIKLLEEAAQRLYKQWFIDLRFPDHETTPIVDGLPQGWKRKIISEVCETVGGGTPSTSKTEYYQNGTIPWATPTDLTKNDCLVLLDTEKKITENGLKNSSAKLLPCNSLLMTSRASIGYFALCDFQVCTNQGFISCIPHNSDMLYYLLFNLMNRVDEIKGKATGSTFLEISKREFRNMEIVEPAEVLLKTYQKNTESIVDKIRVLKKEILYLTQSRDRLLPKLMSDKIKD
jgi:type I restriction enzyme S subunit